MRIAPAAFLLLMLSFGAVGAAAGPAEDAAETGALAVQPLALPAQAPSLPDTALEATEPAAEPAFTGAVEVVGRAAERLAEAGSLPAAEQGVLAAEQQLVAAVDPASDLGWDLLRAPIAKPLLPASTLSVPTRPVWAPVAEAAPASAAVAALGFSGLAPLLGSRLPILPLYSRIEREQAMLNTRRNQLYELVRSDPGIHLSDLVRRSGLGWGAALYHLSVLERNRVLVAHAEGGFKRYFANGMQSRADMGRLAALRHGASKSLFEAVQAAPGRSGRELAAQLGLSPSTLARASERLEDAGLLVRVRQGRRMRYYPSEAPAMQAQVAGAAAA